MSLEEGGAGDMDAELTPLDFEEDLVASNSSVHDSLFDTTIGHIEDIIMEEEFNSIQNGFLEKHYKEFEDTEENKFAYSDIHTEYVNIIELYLGNELGKRIPNFSMMEFQKQLIQRKNELEGEVFEMLLTFSDFMSFKEMVLDYKNEKEGNTIDLSSGLFVRSLSQDPNQRNAAQPSAAAVSQSCLSSLPESQDKYIHNLDVGGQTFMIGMPTGGANTTACNNTDFGLNGVGNSGGLLIGSESMSVSPRPEDSTSPREMDQH